LHALEVGWLAQGVHDVFADHGVQLLTPLFLLSRALLIFLLFRCHRFSESR
jgi:hypothetical protein